MRAANLAGAGSAWCRKGFRRADEGGFDPLVAEPIAHQTHPASHLTAGWRAAEVALVRGRDEVAVELVTVRQGVGHRAELAHARLTGELARESLDGIVGRIKAGKFRI